MRKFTVFLYLGLWLVTASRDVDRATRMDDEELVTHRHTKTGAMWTAKPRRSLQSSNLFKSRLGARMEGPVRRNFSRPTIRHDLADIDLPGSFDAREVWAHCPTVSQIRDQSSCGSCWAFGAAEAISDRVCIHSCGNIQAELSALHLLSCCTSCGDGCYGGWPGLAWDFWKNVGLVSGGSLEHPTGCMNYPFPSCTHHGHGDRPPCRHELYRTPQCQYNCAPGFNKTMQEDMHKGRISYNVAADEKQIMAEVMLNGPVEVTFEVYEDFETYTSGIYFHAWGESVGGHAVKLIGWGYENNAHYWLLANSWNEGWGENGFFRVLRGENECGIESEVVAGLPVDLIL